MTQVARRVIASPPDGGWGWVVVVASFIIHVIADGIVYSFGVFLVEFLDYFGGGKGETAWIGSLVPAITFTVGPVASALTNRYGCRTITIVGALVAASGVLLSLLAPNIYYLYFSFGIMAGFGFGLIYLPAIVSVANYFEKRRSFATGLAVCGSGFGTFIFAPFSEWLLDEFGWKGAFLIESGLILNIVVCGALFRPLNSVNVKLKEDQEELLSQDVCVRLQETASNKELKPTFEGLEEAVASGTVDDAQTSVPKEKSLPSVVCSDEALHLVRCAELRSHHILENSPHRVVTAARSGALYRKDVFYRASLQTIPMYRTQPDVYIKQVMSIPEVSSNKNVVWKKCEWLMPSREFCDTLREMIQFSLLKDGIFLMLVISNIFTSIGFNMPFIYLPDRAIESGIDKHDASYLLSVVGITNTIGRVIFGWLSDRRCVDRLTLYNTSLMICGIATALSPFCRGVYFLLVIYAATFGAFIGVYVSLTSILLVDLLGLDRLTNSFGLLLLFQGATTFVGPPLAGWMFDWTGSYDISFHVMGAMVAFSGFMLYFLPLVKWYRKRRKLPNENKIFEISVPDKRKRTLSA